MELANLSFEAFAFGVEFTICIDVDEGAGWFGIKFCAHKFVNRIPLDRVGYS